MIVLVLDGLFVRCMLFHFKSKMCSTTNTKKNPENANVFVPSEVQRDVLHFYFHLWIW